MQAYQLRTNLLSNPLGIATPQPELSWKTTAAVPDAAQSAYAIAVSSAATFDAASMVWQTAKVVSTNQFGVAYAGTSLRSFSRYYWRVQVWDGEGSASAWSPVAVFETAALNANDWSGRWIAPSCRSYCDKRKAAYFRSCPTLPHGAIARARAYVSALGWYRLFVNDSNVTGDALVPRWTPFDRVVEYQAYDITALLRAGADNAILVMVGDGRFRGFLGLADGRERYGDRLAVFVQFEVEMMDGARVSFGTDETWCVGPGPILSSDPRLGEHVDLRAETGSKECVEVVDLTDRRMVAETVERVRCIEKLLAKQVFKTPLDKQIVDFGQNFAGWIRIKLRAPSGRRVLLTYSEVLTTAGELDTNYICPPLRLAPQQDSVIVTDEEQWFETCFTIHGFRYVEVQGLDYTLDAADVQAKVVSSSLPRTGTFTCSNPHLQRVYQNLLWSVRSNFTDIPTDCPTRERSGWTGDIQVFASTASMFVDCQAFFRHYLRSLALEQLPNGTIPPYIPSQASNFSGGISWMARKAAEATGWGDAAVLLPWMLYWYYGDTTVLRDQYVSMQRWVDHLERRARTQQSWRRWLFCGSGAGEDEKYIVDTGFDWGEWLRPGESPATSLFWQLLVGNPAVPTAYLAHSSRILSNIAVILGHCDEAAYYAKLADACRAAWQAAFVRYHDGRPGSVRIGCDKQDEYVRALSFGLLDPEQEPAAVSRLVELIEDAGYHLGTGFLSTTMLLPVLTEHGRTDVAFRLLLQDTKPSWLGLLERDATTLWETWDGYDSKGNAWYSHNHYALGAFGIWLEESLAGLAPAEPGYKRIRVKPVIGGGITSASTERDTPFGMAKVAWEMKGGIVYLKVKVPPGTVADVHMGLEVATVGSGLFHRVNLRSDFFIERGRLLGPRYSFPVFQTLKLDLTTEQLLSLHLPAHIARLVADEKIVSDAEAYFAKYHLQGPGMGIFTARLTSHPDVGRRWYLDITEHVLREQEVLSST